MKTRRIVIVALSAILVIGCKQEYERREFRVYLYKQPTPNGLICVFYSDNLVAAEENAHIFATMHLEKHGVPLIVRTEPYR